jgi:predicted AlkP superfamily pyrophosphatase or phosphodiesterase
MGGNGATIIEPCFPAVTCVPQTTYLTGKPPSDHGIVANGYYDKECCEIRNWHQSSKVVKSERIFESVTRLGKENGERVTTFSNCWWFSMYDQAIDYMVTPRPQYLQDGGKVADIYTNPPELREKLQASLGTFPLQRFWGPLTSIDSSRWIAKASMEVDRLYNPTLSLIYLPHLDYCLQKFWTGGFHSCPYSPQRD